MPTRAEYYKRLKQAVSLLALGMVKMSTDLMLEALDEIDGCSAGMRELITKKEY